MLPVRILAPASNPDIPIPSVAVLDAAGVDFFERKIRPIFVENCYKCHSAEAEKVKGGLLLDTRDGVIKGGDTGPVIVPGNPDKSLLIKAVRYIDPDLQMPPKNKKLAPEQITDLEAWVKMGAPDPRSAARTLLAAHLVEPDHSQDLVRAGDAGADLGGSGVEEPGEPALHGLAQRRQLSRRLVRVA